MSAVAARARVPWQREPACRGSVSPRAVGGPVLEHVISLYQLITVEVAVALRRSVHECGGRPSARTRYKLISAYDGRGRSRSSPQLQRAWLEWQREPACGGSASPRAVAARAR